MTSDAALDGRLEQRLWVPRPADFVNSPEYRREGKRYRHDHDDIVKRARASPRELRRQTVKGFTGWIHNLYDTKDREVEKSQGSADEKAIEGKEKENWIRQIRSRASKESRWTNIYNTLKAESLRTTELEINGLPLWGKPDLVFRSDHYREILIVERKVHYGGQWYTPEVPIDGWPDLRAQLWAYGYCVRVLKGCANLLKTKGRIRLCADVWVKEAYYKPLERRAVLNWAFDDLEFDGQNRQLFDLYRSKSL